MIPHLPTAMTSTCLQRTYSKCQVKIKQLILLEQCKNSVNTDKSTV